MVSNVRLFYTGSRGLGFRYQIALNYLRGVFDMLDAETTSGFGVHSVNHRIWLFPKIVAKIQIVDQAFYPTCL